MTREVAIEWLKRDVSRLWDTPMNNLHKEALDMAIKALEHEPVLDKIRAEIKALNPEPTAYDVIDGNPIKDAVWETLADVLQIIDSKEGE